MASIPMASSRNEQLIQLVRNLGVIRPRDLATHGIAREHIIRLCEKGDLQRVGRGLYTLAGAPMDENQSLREVCKRVPSGVVCLLSALRFHGLTTQAPHEIWLGIPSKAKAPKPAYPPLRIFRFSDQALRSGVDRHRLAGVEVPVTNPARTVVDCFRFRNKVGLDVALEALRDCLGKKRATPDGLDKMAAQFRMANVMRPYLEALA